jgi:hypothetical protein
MLSHLTYWNKTLLVPLPVIINPSSKNKSEILEPQVQKPLIRNHKEFQAWHDCALFFVLKSIASISASISITDKVSGSLRPVLGVSINSKDCLFDNLQNQ